MSLKPLACSVVLLALGGAACVKKQGSFDAKGYTNHLYDYNVRNGGAGEVMSDAWLLDNYYGEDRKAKRTPDYVTEYQLDTTGNGKTDVTPEELRYDLRYENRFDSGVIWLRTLPLSTTRRDTEPRVLMREYVDALAGSGFTAVTLTPGQLFIESEHLTARVLDAQENRVGNAPAFEAIIEVADVDALQLDPNARKKLAKLVVIRPNFVYSKGRVDFPVLMVAGYVNFPEDFSRSLPDFDSLLARIELGGIATYEPKARLLLPPPVPPAAGPPMGGVVPAAPPPATPPVVAPPPPNEPPSDPLDSPPNE